MLWEPLPYGVADQICTFQRSFTNISEGMQTSWKAQENICTIRQGTMNLVKQTKSSKIECERGEFHRMSELKNLRED